VQKSPFKQLGLSEFASIAEVKQAFRDKAKYLHPDKGGSAVVFNQTVKAYKSALKLAGTKRNFSQRPLGQVDINRDNYMYVNSYHKTNTSNKIEFKVFMFAIGLQLILLVITQLA